MQFSKQSIKPNIYLLINNSMLIYCYVSLDLQFKDIAIVKGTEFTPNLKIWTAQLLEY